MPTRRISDKFAPEPVPDKVSEYRERTWHLLQFIDYKVNLQNGTIQDHNRRIGSVESDVVRGKVIITMLGGLGTIGVFWKKIVGLF